jgi:hypothetical protein
MRPKQFMSTTKVIKFLESTGLGYFDLAKRGATEKKREPKRSQQCGV